MGGVRVRDVLEIVNMAIGVRICTTVITDKHLSLKHIAEPTKPN